WTGDTAQLRVDGRTVDDRFWDGTRWSVSLRDVGADADSAVTLHVLPLSPESTVRLPADAMTQRADAARGVVRAVLLRTVSRQTATTTARARERPLVGGRSQGALLRQQMSEQC